MTLFTSRTLVCASAALLASLSITVASASIAYADEVEHVTRSQTVAYDDLNLASADGAAVLNQRVAIAVDRVCGKANPRDLQQSADRRKCRSAAAAKASSSLNRVLAATGAKRIQTASR